MPYSDTPNDYWQVHQFSDMAEGTVVRNSDGYVISLCDTKADAEQIASLLNRAGVRRVADR